MAVKFGSKQLSVEERVAMGLELPTGCPDPSSPPTAHKRKKTSITDPSPYSATKPPPASYAVVAHCPSSSSSESFGLPYPS